MTRRMVAFLVVVLVGVGVATAAAAPGDLDGTFSGDGIVEVNPSATFDTAFDIAIQEDGKVVTAGRAGGSGGRWFVARFTTAGVLDTTFSGDGKQFVDFGPGDDAALDVVVQGDGRIVLAGMADDVQTFAMARLTAAGALDTTFSGDGRMTHSFRGPRTTEVGQGLVVTSSGRYRVVGRIGDRASVVGVRAGGTLDPTFSGDGLAQVPVAISLGAAIGEGPGGKLTIVGSQTGTGAAGNRTMIARFNANGSPDTTLSGDGRNAVNVVNGYEDAVSLLVFGDGSAMSAGEAHGKLSIVKWLPGGGNDPAFTGDGRQVIDLPGGPEWVSDLQRTSEGYLYLAGRMGGAGGQAFVARLDDAGELDSTFSGDGWIAVDRSSQQDIAHGMVLQEDGDIVAAGSVANDQRGLVFRVEGTEPP